MPSPKSFATHSVLTHIIIYNRLHVLGERLVKRQFTCAGLCPSDLGPKSPFQREVTNNRNRQTVHFSAGHLIII